MSATSSRVKPEVTMEELRELAKAENTAFQAWLNEENEDEGEDGDDLPPDHRYWEPLEAWLRAFDPWIMPIAARQMQELDQAYADFNESGTAMPEQRFWNARGLAYEACMLEPPELKPRKSVAELVAEKVPYAGIAAEWRILDEHGKPDIARLQQEIDHPGSVITPEYIDADNRWRLGQLGWLPADDNPPEPWDPSSLDEKPNLQDLIESRATAEQIGKLMARFWGGSSEDWADQATMLAERLGIGIAANGQEILNEGGRDTAEKQFGKEMVDRNTHGGLPVMPESVINPTEEELGEQFEQPSSEEQQVIDLFQAGEEAGAISRMLGISPKHVKGILRKWTSQKQ